MYIGKPCEFRVIARQASQMRVSRHGISRSQGGNILEVARYQWPDTEVQQALESMRESWPKADLEINGLPTAIERND